MMVFIDYFIINNSNTRNNNNYKDKEQPSKVNVRSNFFYQSSHTGLELKSRGNSYCSKLRLEQFDFNTILILNITYSCADKHIVIWFIVSGREYDALMPWYNQATPHTL